MKPFFILLLASVALLASAGIVEAHGGAEAQIGETTVQFVQEPQSPFINEPVRLSFVLTDKKGEVRTAVPVTLHIVATDPDARLDKEIDKKTVLTDSNGVATFIYRFPEERYYDLQFDLPGSTHTQHDESFLVQARDDQRPAGYTTTWLAISMGIGVLLGIALVKTSRSLRE